MKRQIKTLTFVFAMLFLMASLAACGSSKSDSVSSRNGYYESPQYQNSSSAYYEGAYASEEAYEDYDYYDEEKSEQYFASNTSSSEQLTTDTNLDSKNLKLVYRANMNLNTTEFDETEASIQALVQKYGGYIEYSDLYAGSSYRTRTFTVRIPSENYVAFVNDAEGVGQVTNFNESVENITDRYFDTELRLESAKNRLATLEEMMRQATDMEDMITIQQAISDCQYEIDSYSGTLRQYDNLVGYSTVNVYIQEVAQLQGQEPAPIGFGQRFASAFRNGFRNAGRFFQNLAVDFAYNFLGWVIFIIIAVIAFFVIRKLVRRGREKDRQRALVVQQQRQMMQQNMNSSKQPAMNPQQGNKE